MRTRTTRRARGAIVERFSPIVVAASIDEHYLDFRGCERLYRHAADADDDATILRVVREMTRANRCRAGLPASAGIATSKSMAKVASALAKPAGVLLVRAGTEAATLAPLSVRRLPGIGPVAELRLRALGIETLAELVAAPEALVRPIFGAYTAGIRSAARGEGTDELGRERPAFREHDPRGAISGRSRTSARSSRRRATPRRACCRDCASAWDRGRGNRGVVAGQVTLKLRYNDFHTITRARTIAPTSIDFELHRIVLQIYREAREPAVADPAARHPAREAEARRGPAPALRRRRAPRGLAVDRVREKFGYDAVHLATTPVRRR